MTIALEEILDSVETIHETLEDHVSTKLPYHLGFPLKACGNIHEILHSPKA
jgi:hypothetical protein